MKARHLLIALLMVTAAICSQGQESQQGSIEKYKDMRSRLNQNLDDFKRLKQETETKVKLYQEEEAYGGSYLSNFKLKVQELLNGGLQGMIDVGKQVQQAAVSTAQSLIKLVVRLVANVRKTAKEFHAQFKQVPYHEVLEEAFSYAVEGYVRIYCGAGTDWICWQMAKVVWKEALSYPEDGIGS